MSTQLKFLGWLSIVTLVGIVSLTRTGRAAGQGVEPDARFETRSDARSETRSRSEAGAEVKADLKAEPSATTEPGRIARSLVVAYPPDGHETTSDRIFIVGSAPAAGDVTINGQRIERSGEGHFAPSLPLRMGENVFTLRHQNRELQLKVTRTLAAPAAPTGNTFAPDSLTPAVDLARLPGELICFGAIAPANATVAVAIANQMIPLLPQRSSVDLPPNSAVLTAQNQPTAMTTAQSYQGCFTVPASSSGASSVSLGVPQFQLTVNGQTTRTAGTGKIEVLSAATPQVVEVTADPGTARTGASTDYSRLTPLPQGTRATVTGRDGDWLRLDYGGWIKTAETQVVANAVPPRSLIRSVRSRTVGEWTEIAFPLQTTVPVSVQQGNRRFDLTLYNTTAQTDVIRVEADPLVERIDWQQVSQGRVQYSIRLKPEQQWGYKLRYEGTTLILSLRHAPQRQRDLTGLKILLDPGHGGPEDLGSRGPTGYPEKAVALRISQLVRDRLQARGATVIMTREGDVDLYPNDRVKIINDQEPNLSLSLHYNALPDNGDAAGTSGVSTYWYQTQAHSLAAFMHDYITKKLDRPSYGIYWDNLALTRPTVCPAVLLELGFMINPQEFEWVTDDRQQEKLADAIAAGVVAWYEQTN